MSIRNREVPFSLSRHSREFAGIRELGFNQRGAFVIDAWTTPPVPAGEPRGTYFTALAISPLEYRVKHPGLSGFAYSDFGLAIWDDWGNATEINAPNDVLAEIEQDCIANGLPERKVSK